MTNIITPVKVDIFEDILNSVNYDKKESEFLVDGFRNGFPLHYQGRTDVQLTSPNLKIRVGDETQLWNKVMKEVNLKRYAGPYEKIPFKHFIQSPIGLVPMDGGKDTRLIFHLSYPRGRGLSVNENIPKEMCTVHYLDFREAVQICIREGASCYSRKSDMKSAFRNLCMRVKDFAWLLMKARNPENGKWYYFIDKCLPFGGSISCSHFQRFSNAIAFIMKTRNGKKPINYLDDYLFAALRKILCDRFIKNFLDLCDLIGFPVALEKTEWGSTVVIFLGLLIDTAK